MTNQQYNLRAIVLDILMEVLEHDKYSHIVLRNTLDTFPFMSKQERSFINRLTEGTIEEKIKLDHIINQFSKTPVKKMKPVIRNILRLSVYQLINMSGVPVSAACNEAVKLAKKRGFVNLKGFVNGVLRNISRNLDNISYPDEEKKPVEYLSIMYSMPAWIVTMWIEQFGIEKTKIILNSFLENNDTTIRCRLDLISREELVKRLESENITVEPDQYLDYAFKISNYNQIGRMEAFNEGLFYIQDTSSMMVAEIADIQDNYKVIDVCGAPGGKGIHIAEKLHGTGMVDIRDVSPHKVQLINENIVRSRLLNIKASQKDATNLYQEDIETADIVIADLPCSGLGIVGKKTDIKYKTDIDKISSLAALQKEMLNTVQQYVKPGGTLIYSTCTITKQENQENLEWFLKNYPFELEPIDPYISDKLISESTGKGYLQLLPGIHNTDGFFMARLRKKGN